MEIKERERRGREGEKKSNSSDAFPFVFVYRSPLPLHFVRWRVRVCAALFHRLVLKGFSFLSMKRRQNVSRKHRNRKTNISLIKSAMHRSKESGKKESEFYRTKMRADKLFNFDKLWACAHGKWTANEGRDGKEEKRRILAMMNTRNELFLLSLCRSVALLAFARCARVSLPVEIWTGVRFVFNFHFVPFLRALCLEKVCLPRI